MKNLTGSCVNVSGCRPADFSLCYQGDCRGMTDGDLITLTDGKTTDQYIYEWNNGSLVFYSITNTARSDEMPHYVKEWKFLRLRNISNRSISNVF
ncbi:MAG: hypothetical protein ABI855_06220 [Bacteroidota bacterium]